MTNRYIIITLLVAFAFCECRHNQGNEQLANIESILKDDPQTALDSLDSINYDSLTDTEKHYYDFLMVKVNDKNYIEHETDSLIKEVVAYESRHKGNGRYPESLYYAGRVYSDMGDYPRALSYYQQAFEEISDIQENINLKGRIESQQAQLFIQMGLTEESIPHIKASLSISILAMDTINIMHDMQLLGWVHIKIGKYDEALNYYKDALTLANKKYDYHAAKSRMYISLIKYKQQQTDSALFYINNTVDKVHPAVRNYALAIAADVYIEADMTDSAYKYARELISSNDSIAKEAGYNILLDSKLSNRVSLDTIWTYINNYHRLLNARFNKNNISYALNQQNLYNYQTHVYEKEISEKNNKSLKNTVMWLLLLLVAMISIILYFRNIYTTRIIKLQQALANLNELKISIDQNNSAELAKQMTETESINNGYNTSKDTIININRQIIPKKKELRRRLQDELLQLCENATDNAMVASEILQSDIYRQFKESADHGKMILDSDPQWSDLEHAVLASSPQFINNLYLLASGKLTVADIHTALLIKCGFRPVEMKILLGKTNGAVISRRDSICQKVLDKKMEAKVITNIIRIL